MLIIFQFFIYVGELGVKFVILHSFCVMQIFIRHGKTSFLVSCLKTGYSFSDKWSRCMGTPILDGQQAFTWNI
jgi:hypothetical protein